MLEKILDIYYAKKLGQAIIDRLCIYDLEKYFIISKGKIKFYFNYREENRRFNHNKMIYSIPICISLEILTSRKEQTIEEIKERIDKTF